MCRFAEIILPLPIPSTFTYSVPRQMRDAIKVGTRVLVQFGSRGCNTGIVARLHDNPPAEFQPKDIIMPLDSTPILRNPQLRFWEWIAEYYLCNPGDVMKAALPAALKVESETYVSANPDTIPEDFSVLTENQATLYAFISHAGKIRISDIEKKCEIPNVRAHISRLLEAGLLSVAERIVDKYISRKLNLVRLCCRRGDTAALHACFDAIGKARRQEQLLVAYLDLSGWMHPTEQLRPVERATLLEKSGCSSATLKTLVEKGILAIEQVEVNRFSGVGQTAVVSLPTLTEPQQTALREVRRSMSSNRVTLLRGVTGSGKTEIYSHLISDTLDHGDQALYLVPEISLTTQLTTRLRRIFGDRLLVYHSRFSDNERVDIWRRLLQTREPLLILGVRSSVFLPFARLGLVIVDEEHESSYKQYDPAPRYNARDAAIMLASMHGAKALLGSATPSVETYYKALNGKYGLVELSVRYSGVNLPDVQVVDMRQQRKQKRNRGIFSDTVLQAVESRVKQGKQSIIFQNRRGYAPMLVCHECGWTPKCVNCDVSLVYHKHINELRCHYCGHSVSRPEVCPACGSNALSVFGFGTERIASDIAELIPDAKVTRMDLDTTRNKDSYEEIISKFAGKKTDILVGTQMVSKGLDFQNVTLVAIVNAETILNFPDFRSDERAYNMLEQVAGRAGRHDPGQVIIQTVDPDNPIIAKVVNHDYKAYYDHEIQERSQYAYPPFTKIINIYLRAKNEQTLIDMAVKYTKALQATFGRRVLGPEKPYIGRISNYHIRSLMLKIEAGASMSKVKAILRNIYVRLCADPKMKSILLHYDVDPV
ncbi:MAG: primosomal protein N' [Muribaculaceae bacterium]|nr:primosomal protein N' [Muribaculaceae bacterium]